MKELKILAPCGILGYGYPESSPINKADKNILEENSAVNWIWKMAHQENRKMVKLWNKVILHIL